MAKPSDSSGSSQDSQLLDSDWSRKQRELEEKWRREIREEERARFERLMAATKGPHSAEETSFLHDVLERTSRQVGEAAGCVDQVRGLVKLIVGSNQALVEKIESLESALKEEKTGGALAWFKELGDIVKDNPMGSIVALILLTGILYFLSVTGLSVSEVIDLLSPLSAATPSPGELPSTPVP